MPATMDVFLVLLLVVATLVVPSDATTSGGGHGHHCVWYGRCGRDPKFGDDRHILNCLYEGPPKRAPANDVDKARNCRIQTRINSSSTEHPG